MLVALCCSIVVTAEFVGDINVDSNLRLFSSIKANFKTQQADVSSPKLTINSNVYASLDEIVSYGSNGEIYLRAPSGGISSAHSTHLSVFLASLAPAALLLSTFGSGRKTGLLVAAIFGLVSMILAQTGNLELEIILNYPSGYHFNVVQVELDDGSITSTSGLLSTGELLLNIKSDNGGMVGMSLLSVGSALSVSTSSSVVLEKLSVGSEIQTSVTSSQSSVFLSFINGYEHRGSFNVEFGDSIELPANCSVASDTANNGVKAQSGQCGGDSTGDMALRAKTSVTVRFAVPTATCTDFATIDFTPPMASFDPQSAYPGYVKTYDNETAFIGIAMGGVTFKVNRTAEGITLHKTKYSSNPFALLLNSGYLLPFSLHPDRTYKLSFAIKQDAKNENVNVTADVTVRVFKIWDSTKTDTEQRKYPPGNYTQTTAPSGSSFVIASDNLAASKGITTEWASYSYTFSPPSLASRPYFAIQASFGGAGMFFYKDITFELVEQPFSMPTLHSNEVFRAAYIPAMSAELEPNPRTDCPHLKAGLKKWEDPATWSNNQVPVAGSSVTLPDNTAVLVTPCSFSAIPYAEIVVPEGSELIFADAPIELNVGTIWVHGALRMGSSTCRLYSNIKLTFVGDKASTPTEGKGIVGHIGSVIELHGKQFNPSWSRLAASAMPGSDRLFLQQSVNWEAGQKVLLVTSFMYDDYYDMNEVLTVRAVKNNVVQFTTRIRFYHHAGEEYQTEIGLLSRRIQLEGDEASETAKFGGHLMMMGQGRVSGIETNRMGQFNVLGRYPIHFHLMGIAPGSYATDNSVHDSYFRCITIHGTHEILVSRNVAFKTHGHCYYLEDGVEENSTISFNLAARVAYIGNFATGGSQFMENLPATADRILPADSAAAGFYISNMWNYVRGNAASGGWSGIILPHFKVPTGEFKGTSMPIAPKDKAALEFSGNTAHSSGYYFAIFGGCLYSGGLLWYDSNGVLTYNGGRTQGSDNRNARKWVGDKIVDTALNITNFKSWLCGQGTNHWGNSVEFRNSESWDVGRGATLFGPALGADSVFGVTKSPMGYPKTNSYGQPAGSQGFQFYDQWSVAILSNVTFVGYKNDTRFVNSVSVNQNTNCLSVLNNIDQTLNQGISAVSGIKYDDCDDAVRVQSDTGFARKSVNIEDWDGSVTGIPGGAIIGSWAGIWNGGDDCYYDGDWRTWVCPRRPGREIINVGIHPSNYTGAAGDVAGSITLCGRPTTATNFTFGQSGATGISGECWFVRYPNNGAPKTWSFLPTRVPPNAKAYFALSYPAGTTFNITYADRYFGTKGNFLQVFNTTALLTTPLSYYFNGQYLYVNVKNYEIRSGVPHFTRNGVTVWGIDGFNSPVTIRASCTASVAVNFCPVSTTTVPPSLNILT